MDLSLLFFLLAVVLALVDQFTAARVLPGAVASLAAAHVVGGVLT